MTDSGNKPGHHLIFLHIPKTAGITLNRIIERHYRKNDIFTVGIDGSLDDLQNLSTSRKSGLRLLRGHTHSGVHELLP